jgi:hypothetical protein
MSATWYKPIARRVARQQAVRRVQAVEPQHGLAFGSLERLNPGALGKGTGPLVAETHNHLSLLQKSFFCHPERSEGSQASEITRFFATLSMTMVVNGEFCKRLIY